MPKPLPRLNFATDRELIQQLQFHGVPEDSRRLLIASELERLSLILKTAGSEDGNIVEAVGARLASLGEVLNNSPQHGAMTEGVAHLELEDLVEGELGRDRQTKYLREELGVEYLVQRVALGEANLVFYLTISAKDQVDRKGRRFDKYEALPSFQRRVPRISRSIVG